eukprot:1212517-Amorphochlora_amoeboformis.AAC.1
MFDDALVADILLDVFVPPIFVEVPGARFTPFHLAASAVASEKDGFWEVAVAVPVTVAGVFTDVDAGAFMMRASPLSDDF